MPIEQLLKNNQTSWRVILFQKLTAFIEVINSDKVATAFLSLKYLVEDIPITQVCENELITIWVYVWRISIFAQSFKLLSAEKVLKFLVNDSQE